MDERSPLPEREGLTSREDEAAEWVGPMEKTFLCSEAVSAILCGRVLDSSDELGRDCSRLVVDGEVAGGETCGVRAAGVCLDSSFSAAARTAARSGWASREFDAAGVMGGVCMTEDDG